jgi:hypothetical protein
MNPNSTFKFSNSQILKFVFFFFFIISFQSIAQTNEESRLSVNVAAGSSLSLRTIYQKFYTDDRGQLAGDGWAAQFGATYRFMKHFGITARVNYNQNHTREEGVAKIALYQYGITAPNITQNVDWSGISGLIGPSVHLFTGRFAFEGRALIGYATVTGPEFALDGVFSGRKINVKTVTGNAQSMALGAGTTLRFKTNKWLSFTLSSDFVTANTQFDNVASVVTSSGFTANPISSIDQKVGFLNVMGGLQFNF